MLLRKIAFALSLFLSVSSSAFSAEDKKSGFDFYYVFEGAYDFASEFRTGGDHFSLINGLYGGIEMRSSMHADYKLSIPLGQNMLVSDSNITLGTVLELSPITVKPGVSVSLNPFPFLSFSAGAEIGTGWNMLSFEGMCVFNKNPDAPKYDRLNPFDRFYYNFWARGTFMFDTGAITGGDWSHFLFVATCTIFNNGLSGCGAGDLYKWQATGNYASGLQYLASFVIGYQMPLRLYRVGIMSDVSAHFNSSDFGEFDKTYDGSFVFISASPFAQLRITPKDNLYLLADIKSRRSFSEPRIDAPSEPYLHTVGREWFLERIGIRYEHMF